MCLVVSVGFLAYALFAEDFAGWRVLAGLASPLVAAIGIGAWRQGRRGTANIPMFDVTAEGIAHSRAGLIRWDEIEDVRIYSLMGQRALGIWTRDPDIVATRIGKPWARAMSRLNRSFGFAPMSFSGDAIPIDETLAEIERRRIRR